MEMVENHNPNSHECLRRDTPPKSWSELPLDLLSLVFERLGFADFQRGKSVCSSWYSASRQSVPKNQIPWLILFPEQNKKNFCTLFNPEEKDKLYKTQDLGVEFAKSFCIATYGSWLLMQDPRYNLSILNLFTHEMIDLPPVESQFGTTKVERTLDDRFHISNHCEQRTSDGIAIRYPVFWIDEKTKDYVVLWVFARWCVVMYSKRGDNLWKQLIPETSECIDMVYKDHKLYLLSNSGGFYIFDFSGEIPREIFECGLSLNRVSLGRRRRDGRLSISRCFVATKLVVTVTGDVLKVEKWVKPRSGIWSFRLYKFYSSGLYKKSEQVDSLGDEAMLFDLGITVLANGLEGFKRNSIYFDRSSGKNSNEISLFNLETQKSEKLHEFDGSSVQLSTARWFLPSFTQTID